jgi:hypothetical protein
LQRRSKRSLEAESKLRLETFGSEDAKLGLR